AVGPVIGPRDFERNKFPQPSISECMDAASALALSLAVTGTLRRARRLATNRAARRRAKRQLAQLAEASLKFPETPRHGVSAGGDGRRVARAVTIAERGSERLRALKAVDRRR